MPFSLSAFSVRQPASAIPREVTAWMHALHKIICIGEKYIAFHHASTHSICIDFKPHQRKEKTYKFCRKKNALQVKSSRQLFP